MIVLTLQAGFDGGGRRPVVLVVDDDQDIRFLIRFHLEPAGYEVHEAHDGAEALRHLGERDFDGVVLDLRMPGVDGYAVLDAMRDRGMLERTPVLTCSAHASHEAIASLTGTRGHVAKPFKPDELVRAVTDMVGGQAA
jgi:CheY-like chemotaxis protein